MMKASLRFKRRVTEILLLFILGVPLHIVYCGFSLLGELHIGGIFPIGGKGGWQGGQACMPAARLALEDVNARDDLLPGFKLTLHSNDSEVIILIFFCFTIITFYFLLFLIVTCFIEINY